MVAKITMPGSAKRVLNYNEQKVGKRVAECIGGEHFLGEANALNVQQKLLLFEHRNELNNRASTKMIHISLNFDSSESLNNERLLNIASDYMQKIGFGEQPYFVYRHHDAGHPHIHIVSTTIRCDGSRINTHNLGRNQSSRARREIEKEYGLVKAELRKKVPIPVRVTEDIQKAQYGMGETGGIIVRIVQGVTGSFNFTSLTELNAALGLYNVVAVVGTEDSHKISRKELHYYILDESGQKTGVGIKAGFLPGKPVMAWLEKRYVENKLHRPLFKKLLRQTLDLVLSQQPSDFLAFQRDLSRMSITVLLHTNAEGRHYGITFIDNQNKSVFNGSEIGKEYSIASLQNIIPSLVGSEQAQVVHPPLQKDTIYKPEITVKKGTPLYAGSNKTGTHLIQDLLTPVPGYEGIPAPLLQKKGKRKKKRKQS